MLNIWFLVCTWIMAGYIGGFLHAITTGMDDFQSEDGPVKFRLSTHLIMGYFSLITGFFMLILVGPGYFISTINYLKDNIIQLFKRN